MKDPYLNSILGLLATGLTCSAFSISGWLHGTELLKFGGIEIRYPAAHRKLPLSVTGFGFCFSAWYLTQDRKEWKRQYRQWQRQREQMQLQRSAIAAQAELQGFSQLAQLQAAEQLYPQMQPYLDAQYEELPQQVSGQTIPQTQGQPSAPTAQTTTEQSVPGQPASPTIIVPTKQFAEEDLAARLAQTTHDPSTAGSTLIACPKGTGKSNLLRAAIASAHQLHQGKAEFVVLAGKDDETYCGLEQNPKTYLYSGEVQNANAVFDRMAEYQARLKRFVGSATIFVMDEYNNTLEAARMHDRLSGSKQKKEDLISALTYERITKGRSKLVCDWITSHEPDVRHKP